MKSLAKLFDWQTNEIRSEDSFLFALTTTDKFVNAYHLNSISRFDGVD